MPLDLIEKRGIHRVQNGWGDENSVFISWGTYGFMTVPECQYRTENYQPPFDELPWKGDKFRSGLLRPSRATEMPDTTIMPNCFLCKRSFQSGPNVNDGRPVRTWGVTICRDCLDGNWDGIVPAHHSNLIPHLLANGIKVSYNANGG